ncbi:MAG: DUF2804 domain-containing protein [Treponema sp.]|nr:DUF2804 domain-containing protein [Treponema sp.]
MYVREIQPPRATPIDKGKQVQGTWTEAFDEVNLLDIRKPYRFPIPRGLRDSRIKEWESFLIQDDKYLLFAVLANIKVCRYASIILYDKENKEKLWFKKLIPGTGWHLPRSLKNASVDSRSWGFFFRIHSWLDAHTIKLDLDIEPTRKRPSFTAHAEFNLAEEPGQPMVQPQAVQPEAAQSIAVQPLTVSLMYAENRGMYTYKTMAPVRGDMVFGGRHISLNPARTSGLFCDFKGFFPYGGNSQWCGALFLDAAGRRIGFTVSENPARESYANNENCLWIDGVLTPLPPVKITRNAEDEPEWIIQDMEGMVDLVFTPVVQIRYKLNILLSQSFYDSPPGLFNGMIVSSKGEEIHLKNVYGLGEKLHLQV